jgi:hypothetical protein
MVMGATYRIVGFVYDSSVPGFGILGSCRMGAL